MSRVSTGRIGRVAFGELVTDGIDAIIFDKDGTLIDIWPMLRALAEERYRHLAAEVSPAALAKCQRGAGYDPGTGRIDPRGPLACARRADEVAVGAAALYQAGFGWHEAWAIIARAYDSADRTLDVGRGLVALPGVPEALAALGAAGVKMAVATTDGHARSVAMLARLGLAGLLGTVVAGDDVDAAKPDPAFVLAACRQLGVDPRRCVVVGDSTVDLKMGRNAGAGLTVGVLTGTAGRDELAPLADVVLASAGDIRPLGQP